jgi:FKBP-type peptidyl-prolyl cis-trans isomerase (trigger factor)
VTKYVDKQFSMKQIHNQVFKQVHKQVHNQLYTQVSNHLLNQASEKVTVHLRNMILGQVYRQMTLQVKQNILIYEVNIYAST